MQQNIFNTGNTQPDLSDIHVKIEDSWKSTLAEEFRQEYFSGIKSFLKQEKNDGQTIYPPGPQIFNAFNHTPLNKVKAVILGQDPYHGRGQAHGLCFSVADNVKPPPSLVNIFKEISQDLNIQFSGTGNLEPWANQGVFLLNAILTVRASQPASHKDIGWAQFTDAVIKKISYLKENVVFLLWGNFARSKEVLIDHTKHLILQAPHPSPFSAHNGFFGCGHFSKTNDYLISKGMEPIDWKV